MRTIRGRQWWATACLLVAGVPVMAQQRPLDLPSGPVPVAPTPIQIQVPPQTPVTTPAPPPSLPSNPAPVVAPPPSVPVSVPAPQTSAPPPPLSMPPVQQPYTYSMTGTSLPPTPRTVVPVTGSTLMSDHAAPMGMSAMPAHSSSESEVFGHEDGEGEKPSRFFIDAEYLLIRPMNSAHDYAIIGPTNTNNTGPIGSIAQVNWDWDSGFRIGGGMTIHDEWQVAFYYTYVHSNQNENVYAGAGETVYPTWTHPGTVETATAAAADAGLNYNVFDLELQHSYQASKTLKFRVFGGPRYAHIDQTLSALYTGGDANMDNVLSKLHYDGVGLSLGGEVNWDLYYGWGAYARGRLSMLMGEYRNSLVETNNGGATTITNVTENFSKVTPVLELAMGFSYQFKSVRLTAGYELTNWFGLVDVPDFVDDVAIGKVGQRTGDLSLGGLMLRAQWDF